MNFYSVYRWALLGVTLFNVFNVVMSALEYKQYYDKLPNGLRLYLQQKTVQILGDKISKNKKDLWINIALLVVLISLNIVSFLV